MPKHHTIQWAYGVTTVPSRRDNLLLGTLTSLRLAGFDKPWVFIDGCEDPRLYWQWFEDRGLQYAGLTSHYPYVRTAGNWILSMWELWIRNPTCTRFALFQDDLVTYRNLRQYLDRCAFPSKGYWNLYTFNSNTGIAPVDDNGRTRVGWYKSNQFGRGAVGLVFDRQGVVDLLGNHHLSDRVQDLHRGWRAIDGGIVTALGKCGYTEMVHHPSLLQHTGQVSAMWNKPHQPAPHFLGESYDALLLLEDSIQPTPPRPATQAP
jgi:hypothetical protein